MTANGHRATLLAAFDAAVAAAHPRQCLPPHLPDPPGSGRLVVLAAGKAAGSMAATAEASTASSMGSDPTASPDLRSHATATARRPARSR
jgi:glycerate 2-kinase